MIAVSREAPEGPEWADWQERANKATQGLIDDYKAGKEIAIKASLYKEAKPFLDKLFGGKCAYCEVLIETSHPIEVEHYRPKGRVKDESGAIVVIERSGKKGEHEGYWWLAYQWPNLLPSCIDCNRRRGHGDDGDMAGKADIFPVEGTRAVEPGEEANEVPMLLNPCEPDFKASDHFDFLKDGRIKPKTVRGQRTCELLGLNIRERAVARRASVFSEARRSIRSYVLWLATLTPESDDTENDRTAVNAFWTGKTEFSAFGRVGLDSVLSELRARSPVYAALVPPL